MEHDWPSSVTPMSCGHEPGGVGRAGHGGGERTDDGAVVGLCAEDDLAGVLAGDEPIDEGSVAGGADDLHAVDLGGIAGEGAVAE